MSKRSKMNGGCIENAYFEISGVKESGPNESGVNESGAFDVAMGGKGRL